MKRATWNLVTSAILSFALQRAAPAAEKPLPILCVYCEHDAELGLLTIEADGSNPALLAKGIFSMPAWSPDGTTIAYFRGSHVWLMNADGTRQRQFTGVGDNPDPAIYCDSPVWSPDGKRIVYNQKGSQADIVITGVDEFKPIKLTSHRGFSGWPAFSPDGRSILYESDSNGSPRLWLMDTDGANKRLAMGTDVLYASPCWSPDGKMIAFTRATSKGMQLFVADTSGASLRAVTDAMAMNMMSAWSPDGRYIAYVHHDKWPTNFSDPMPGDLMVLDVVNDTRKRILNGTLVRWGSRPAWKPLPAEHKK